MTHLGFDMRFQRGHTSMLRVCFLLKNPRVGQFLLYFGDLERSMSPYKRSIFEADSPSDSVTYLGFHVRL